MNQKFSNYLKDIGLLNDTVTSSIMKSYDKSSNKSFNDSSFDLLMNYFNNLDEKQKKFMSYHIPSKFIIISSKMKKDKLRSIIVQSILRKKLIILKYFLFWKFCSYINKDNYAINKNITSKLTLVNIDNNTDPDILSKNGEVQKSKENQSNINSNEINFKQFSNSKNIRNTYNSNNSENSNYKYINVYRNKNEPDLKSYNLSENKIRPNNKYKSKSLSSQKKRKINKSIYRENNSTIRTHLMTSLEEKEMLELEECYFKPKINKIRKNKELNEINTDKKNKQEVFEKLYKYNEKYKLAKELKALELEKIAGQKNTFIPNTNPMYRKNKKLKKNRYRNWI